MGLNMKEKQAVTREYIVLLPRKHKFKIGDTCVDYWDHAHPLGCLGTSRGRWADTATAQGIGGAGPPQVAGPLVVAIGRASGGIPDTPEFSAQPKMRPNEILPESHIFVNSLQGEAL
jgi:hypothetical protein